MRSRNIWLYSFFVALLYTLVYGYMFNRGDQAEHLPQVYHRLNPTLYSGDFFMEEYMKNFTIRDYYVILVAFLSRFAPTEWVCFALHMFSVTFSAYAIFKITQTLSTNKLAPFIAPLFALIVFRDFTVGGNSTQDIQFISSSLAVPLVLFAFYRLLQEKYVAAGFFAGIACLAQPLIGIQGFLLIFGIAILRNKSIPFSSIVYSLLAFAAGSALMLSPLIIRQFLTPGNVDSALYLELLYSFRNYTHYIPHLFPKLDFLKFSILLIPALVLLLKNKTQQGKTLKIFFALTLAGLLFYTFCMETQTLYGIGKMQWFKTTVWLTIFSSILLAVWVCGLFDKYISNSTGLSPKLTTLLLTVPSVLLFVFITNSGLVKDFNEKYQIGNYVKSDRTLLLEWVEKHTPINAVVLVSPDDDSFACIAKRPQPVSFKAIIHEPGFMLRWYAKVKEYYGIAVDNTEGRKPMDAASSLYKERNYKEHITQVSNISYRIDNIQTCQYINNLGPVVHQEGNWVLTVF